MTHNVCSSNAVPHSMFLIIECGMERVLYHRVKRRFNQALTNELSVIATAVRRRQSSIKYRFMAQQKCY